MKRSLILCFLFSVSCLGGVAAPSAHAAGEKGSQHMTTDKILEFSLSRLKESVERALQKNDRFAFENEVLRKNIYDLQQKKEFLIEKKTALSGKRPQPYEREREARLIEAADPDGRKQRTLELISIFQRDISRLKENAQVLEDSLGGMEFNSHKRMLLEEKEAGEKNFIQLEKKLKLLEQNGKSPVERIRALQEKQNELVQQVKALEAELYRF